MAACRCYTEDAVQQAWQGMSRGQLTVTAWLSKDASVAGMVKSSGMKPAPTEIVTLAEKVPKAGIGTRNKVEKGLDVDASNQGCRLRRKAGAVSSKTIQPLPLHGTAQLVSQ